MNLILIILAIIGTAVVTKYIIFGVKDWLDAYNLKNFHAGRDCQRQIMLNYADWFSEDPKTMEFLKEFSNSDKDCIWEIREKWRKNKGI